MATQQKLFGGWSGFGGCQPKKPCQSQKPCQSPPAPQQHHCQHGQQGRTVIDVDVHHYRCRDGEVRTCGGPFAGSAGSASTVNQNYNSFGAQGWCPSSANYACSPFGGYSGSFDGGYQSSYGGYQANYGGSYGSGSFGGYQAGYEGSYGGGSFGGYQAGYEGSYGGGSFGGYQAGYQGSYGGGSFGGYQAGYQGSYGGAQPNYGGLYPGAFGSNYPQLQTNPNFGSAFSGIQSMGTMSLIGSALSLLF